MEQSNSIKRNDELVIDLKELFWRLVEQWKAMVVFVIIIMLLFSGFMYARSSAAIEAESETSGTIKTPEDILVGLSEDDQEMVMGVLSEREARDNARDYIKESLLMNLDPYNLDTLTVSWIVNSNENINKQLVSAYVNELSSYETASVINHAWGDQYDNSHVKELVRVSTGLLLDTEANLGSNTVILTVYLPKDGNAEAAMDAVSARITEITGSLSNSIGSHEISLVNSEEQTTSDQLLADEQYNAYNRFYSLNSQVTNLTNSLSSDQKAAFDSLINYIEENEDTDNEPESADSHKAKFLSKRNLAVGFILGCFLYGGVYLLYFLFSGRIFSTSGLEKTYGLRTLGEWYPYRKAGLLLKFIESSIINKKRHKGHTNLDAEVDRICESIVNVFGEEDDKGILLVSSNNNSDNTNSLIDALASKLKINGISVLQAEINTSEGLTLSENSLAPAKAAAIIIDEKNFKHKDVKEACDKCQYCNKPLIGTVFVC